MQSATSTQLDLTQRSHALTQSLSGKVFLTVAASVFIAACAHVSIPLPFTPVPLTLQNFAVVLVGLLLGPVAGFSAVVLYLAEGAMGLPVFPPSGIPGIAHLMGPNAGYLFAYPVAAAVAGWVAGAIQRVTSRFVAGAVAATVATAPIFICGASWLSHLLHTGASATWTMAVAPFLPGEVVKIAAAAGIFNALSRLKRA